MTTPPTVHRKCALLIMVLAVLRTASAAETLRDCTAVATGHQEINVSSGVYSERAVAVVPLKIKIPTGVDAGLEAACLEVEGRDAGSTLTAEFERAEACRQASSRVQLVDTAGNAPGRIGGHFDRAAYEACLRGDIEVEVLAPD